MSRQKTFIVLFIGLFIPAIMKAEGQDALVYILDAFALFASIFVWTNLFLVSLFLVRRIRKKPTNKSLKLTVGIICILCAAFQFIMTKTDSRPYEGPIDEFIHRAWKVQDSLELSNGKTNR